jgi:hypothetical protein
MDTTRSSVAPPQRINAVRQYVAYRAPEMPRVELLVLAGHGGEATWMPGQVRMHTHHEDGTRTTTAQYRLDGRLLVDNFPEGLVRPQ